MLFVVVLFEGWNERHKQVPLESKNSGKQSQVEVFSFHNEFFRQMQLPKPSYWNVGLHPQVYTPIVLSSTFLCAAPSH